MEDVNISIYRASVVREGSTPASPGFVVSDGQNPVDPSGSGQNHLPVTIADAATGLSITESQVLGGAGTVGQYIRGDGSLADFPESSGGGSSVSYYLNGSVAQGTIGGVAYKELNKVPILGAGTDFTINANGYIASFITDAGDPNLLEIPAGNWNFETYFSASSGGGSPSFYVELYKVNSGGTATLIASNSTFPELIAFGTNIISYFSTLAVPTTALALTDRLAIRYYVTHSGRTITLHTEDNHLCQIVTTFTTGLTALNGLTAQIQNFAVGTSGTDFAIASATATHTFNLPTASATNRGALSSADWTTFNNKTSNLGTVTSVGLSSATSGVTIGSTPVTTSGTITLAIATASGSQNGLLSSTDWTTFNGKQNALTNPVTGTGTTNYLPKFTGASTIGNSQIIDNGTQVGIGNASPAAERKLTVAGGAQFTFASNSGASFNIIPAANGQDGADFNLSYYTGSAYGPLNFIVGESTRLRINPNGNLLVGTTTDNGARLQVSGSATISSSLTVNTTATIKSFLYLGESLVENGVINSPEGIYINADSDASGGTNDIVFGKGRTSTSGGTTFMTIKNGGNVGIGESIPNYKLHIVNPSASAFLGISNEGSSTGNRQLRIGFGGAGADTFASIQGTRLNVADDVNIAMQSGGGNVLIGTATSGGYKCEIQTSSTNAALWVQTGGTTSSYIIAEFRTGTNAPALKITGNGNVGLSRTYDFTTSNAANVYIDSGDGFLYRSTSSIKYKTNVKNYDKGLDVLSKMRPVYYEGIGNLDSGKMFAGLIAEDIHELGLTEFVQYAKDGSPDALAYQNMVALLIKSIQELKQEIDTLKN